MDVTILVPFYNEEDNVVAFHEALAGVLGACREIDEYEILYIDDGSCDDTLSLLEGIQATDPHVVVLCLRRNFGQTAALAAGFDFSRGDIIVTIDGDMQYDAQDILKLLHHIKDCDMVCGWRKHRQDPLLSRRIPSMITNWLINIVTSVRLHDHGCALRAYKREVIKNLKLYGEMQRFIPALASKYGIKVTEIETWHQRRQRGKSKYAHSKTLRLVLDLLVVKFFQSFSTKPMQFFGPPGLFSGLLGGAILIYSTVKRFMAPVSVDIIPIFLLGAFLILVGLQFLGLGLLGEIQVRNYYESERKPIYSIKRIIKDDS
ncbi:MAG: glycosyltransferase family 2 protein [Nitrospirae bacterium]|uniref:glycosyltransferase family 2 protein n=1 Tax=Candidatus Magnetobacterium casense TaxID=1455061 RepID=UPI00058ACDCF|nr:glycosyltransferase family 2 protein [Candidatus Magnetobacterium casensis]MBF0337547.1 glycosyltransferase family 2 protein [Nitrospirota bacterium]